MSANCILAHFSSFARGFCKIHKAFTSGYTAEEKQRPLPEQEPLKKQIRKTQRLENCGARRAAFKPYF
jgi:hypothetical protein